MPSLLFSPYDCRGVRLKNRVGVAPMCLYSAQDGFPQTWHLVHLGSRAVGGAGLVFVEAAAVSAQGRISPHDLGIWSPDHARALQPISAFIREQGAAAGIQLAHAGRKGSTQVPWVGRSRVPPDEGGWETLAPSATPFNDHYPQPVAMTTSDIDAVVRDFVQAAQYSLSAGFNVLELHMGHGYLIHQFLSPLSNTRTDAYGGDFEGRSRLALEVAGAVRQVWPEELPLFVRLSATDWIAGGWDIDQSVALSKRLGHLGIDVIDCSSGSIVPASRVEHTPGFQVPLSQAIRAQAGISTAAVGMITDARQAEEILQAEQADLILMARQMLRDPYWPLRAQMTLDGAAPWPVQYQRAVSS